MEDHQVYLGNQLIGVARNVSPDFPNMIGVFEPTENFEAVKEIFVQEYNLIKAQADAWAQIRDKLFAMGVRLESQSGTVISGTPSGTLKPGTIAYLHIHDGKIWWRPV